MGKRLLGLVSVSYTRSGESFTYLTFSSKKFMEKWLRMLEQGGAEDIKVEWDAH